MKFKILMFIAIAAVFLSTNGTFPVGQTGAPGDGFCGNCHSPSNPNFDGTITIDGLPASIDPTTSYTITVTVANPNGNATKAGFSIVALNSNNTNAGDFSSPSPQSTLITSNGKEYFGHQPGVNFPPSDELTWTVNWLSPANSTTVTMYGASVIANGNGSSNLDRPVATNVSGTVDAGTPLSVTITNVKSTSCWNSSDGEATANASGGTGTYFYNWDSGANTATATNLSPGAHTVTVTSGPSNQTANTNIPSPSQVNVSIFVAGQITCSGDSDGSLTASGSGGTGAITYNWSNGSNGQTISGLVSNLYSVTATDANSCIRVGSLFLSEPDAISVSSENVSQITCNGANNGAISIVPNGGTGFLNTQWSNGQSGNVIFDLSPGPYSVTITDINSCTFTKSYTITQPPVITLNIQSTTNATCQGVANGGATVAATGGSGGFTYKWSTGAIGATLNNVVAGNYMVTATDSHSCVKTIPVVIGANTTASIALATATNVTCFGGANGSATAAIQNGTGYTIHWSNGQTGTTLSNVVANAYTAMATNTAGCVSNQIQVNISQPAAIKNNGSVVTQITCNNANNGSISAMFAGGSNNYTSYEWSNDSTDQTISNLAGATYHVVVTDNVGCIGSDSFVIVNPVALSMDNDTITNNACFGDSNGSIEVEINGGAGDLHITWSNGDTVNVIDSLSSGTYYSTLTDANNCQLIDSFEVTSPSELAITMVGNNESAAGAEDGSAIASVSGGIAGYGYLWNTGAITDTIDSLLPGLYIVTVTDANNCQKTNQVNIFSGDCALNVGYQSTGVSCFGNNDGIIELDVTEAIEPYTIQVSGTGTPPYDLDSLTAGEYNIMVTDSIGCSFSVTGILIEEPDPIAILVDTVYQATGDHNSNGGIDVSSVGGTEPYEFVWLNEASDTVAVTEDVSGLLPGLYTVIITDANGCTLESEEVEVGSSNSLVEEDIRFTLVPNPSTDFLFLTFSQNISSIFISDASGKRTHYTVNPNDRELSIDMNMFSPGVYTLVFISKNGGKAEKIIKL